MSSGLIIGAITTGLIAIIAAFIAAGETALTRISHARAEALAAEGLPGAEALAAVLTDREASLALLLLLRIIFHLVAATIVTVIVVDRVGTTWVPVAAAVEVVVLYVVAEAMPRTWALQHPDVAARRAAPMVGIVRRIAPLRWATHALNGVSNMLLPGPARPPVVTEDELIANQKTPAQICEAIGADSLGYLSLEGLRVSAEPLKVGICDACFSLEYPVPVENTKAPPQLSLFLDVSEERD